MNRAICRSILCGLCALPLSAVAADGKDIYDKVCYKCHRSGVDDAPRLSDKAAWAPRLATGKDALYKSVIEGKEAMPPRADRPELSDEAIQAAVDYIVEKVR